MCILGPKQLIKIAIISDPPAIPNLKGCAKPGNAIGTNPAAIPNANPKKIDARLGTSNRFVELPNRLSILSTARSSPTTVMRSPNCKRRSRVANSSTPARRIRVIETW